MSDSSFNAFMTWQTVLFCLGIGVLVFVLRTLVEAFWQGAKTNLYWREVALPIGPVATGCLLVVVMHSFPFPLPIQDTLAGKLFYGGLCGMSSAWVFGRFRSFLNAAADSNEPIAPIAQRVLHRPSSMPPPPNTPSLPPARHPPFDGDR